MREVTDTDSPPLLLSCSFYISAFLWFGFYHWSIYLVSSQLFRCLPPPTPYQPWGDKPLPTAIYSAQGRSHTEGRAENIALTIIYFIIIFTDQRYETFWWPYIQTRFCIEDLGLKIWDFTHQFVFEWWNVDRGFAGSKKEI